MARMPAGGKFVQEIRSATGPLVRDRLLWVGAGHPSPCTESRSRATERQCCVEKVRAPSVRRKPIAQDRRDVLALAKQPNDIQMVSAFEVAPQQRELCDPPRSKPRNVDALSEHRRTNARVKFDLVERGVGCLDHSYSHTVATLLAGVTDFALLVVQCLRAQYNRLQSISPRAMANSSFSSALVRRRPGPDASPSSMRSRSRFLACSS